MKKMFWGFIFLLIFFIVGCSSVPSGSGSSSQETSSGQEADVNDSGLTAPPEVPVGSSATAPPTGETTTIVLYFADNDGNLAPEQREVPKVPGIARQTMEELCKGPNVQGLVNAIPEGTRLLDVNIRDDLCTVDFSKELVEKHPGGSSGELLTIYSIVNTLTQFPSVKQVAFLIEGQRVESLAGHMDLTVPIERNSDMLKN